MDYNNMANAIRVLAMDAVQQANSGHPGMPMGFADVATVLFSNYMKFDATQPNWADRDRFILSAGHGSMLQYALLYLTGNPHISLDDIKNFRQLHSKTPGHPEYGHTSGIETTTGPLGAGMANAVGFALAERHLNARFGNDLVHHKTYVIVGDGCLMEGISQEAISMAGHWKLKNLIVLWDDNDICIDGAVSMSTSDNQKMRFKASGWQVLSCDGHDYNHINTALAQAQNSDRPVLIACKTVIGKGSPNKAGSASSHGAPLGADEISLAKQQLGCDWGEAFCIPDTILAKWRAVGTRGKSEVTAWEQRLHTSTHKDTFLNTLQMDTTHIQPIINKYKKTLSADAPKVATRKASQMALQVLNPALPQLIGGSADLTGSNLTKTTDLKVLTADNYSGRYIHYGIREHGMGAVMNGLALHGGCIPYGGTFLVFTDYCRPSIRLSALMGIRVIYVMTHDSIGLGEDGPTHQPIEHISALRAIPNLHVFRPADAVETAESWVLSIMTKTTPSILALSRQGLPTVRTTHTDENLTAKGAYILSPAQGKTIATLIASGSEVEIALNAQSALAKNGTSVSVVSAPCLDLFNIQSDDYKQSVLGQSPRIVIEAGIRQGWEGILRPDDTFIGMQGFGASAPADTLYTEFNITVDAVIQTVKSI